MAMSLEEADAILAVAGFEDTEANLELVYWLERSIVDWGL